MKLICNLLLNVIVTIWSLWVFAFGRADFNAPYFKWFMKCWDAKDKSGGIVWHEFLAIMKYLCLHYINRHDEAERFYEYTDYVDMAPFTYENRGKYSEEDWDILVNMIYGLYSNDEIKSTQKEKNLENNDTANKEEVKIISPETIDKTEQEKSALYKHVENYNPVLSEESKLEEPKVDELLPKEEPTYEWEEEKKSKRWLWILGAVLLLGILGGGYYFMSNQEEGEEVAAYVQETDSIPEISVSSDDTPPEDVEQRLKEILTALIKDNGDRYLAEYFTEGFDAYYNRAWEKANKEGVEGPRIWWQYSDDYPTDFSINSINEITTSEPIANITVKGVLCHGIYDVSLKMEDGHWKIDRINEKESNSKEVKEIENKRDFIEEMYDVFFGSRKSESYEIDNVKKYLSQRVLERITFESPYENGQKYFILDYFRDGSLGFERPDYGDNVVDMEINSIGDGWFEVINTWSVIKTPVKVRLKVVTDKNGEYKVVDFK